MSQRLMHDTPEAPAFARWFVDCHTRAARGLELAALGGLWSAPCLEVVNGVAHVRGSTDRATDGPPRLLAHFDRLAPQSPDEPRHDLDRLSDACWGLSLRWRLGDADGSSEHSIDHRYVLWTVGGACRVLTAVAFDPTLADAPAHDPTHDPAAIADAFVREYRAAFRTLEPGLVAPYWCAPTLAIDHTGVKICASQPEVVDAFVESLPRLRAMGVRDVLPTVASVRAIGPTTLEVAVDWALTDDSGMARKRLKPIYLLRRTEGAWKVGAVYLPA